MTPGSSDPWQADFPSWADRETLTGSISRKGPGPRSWRAAALPCSMPGSWKALAEQGFPGDGERGLPSRFSFSGESPSWLGQGGRALRLGRGLAGPSRRTFLSARGLPELQAELRKPLELLKGSGQASPWGNNAAWQ